MLTNCVVSFYTPHYRLMNVHSQKVFDLFDPVFRLIPWLQPLLYDAQIQLWETFPP